MINKIICYFQEVEPNSSAVAIRSKFFIRAFQLSLNSRINSIQIITASQFIKSTYPLRVDHIRLSFTGSTESSSSISRVIKEFIFGVKAFIWFSFNHNNALLVISSPNYIPSIFLSYAARLCKSPYILDIRDAYPQAYAQSGLISESSIIYKFFSSISASMYSHATAIAVATNGLKSSINSAKCPVHAIYNGFPAEFIGMQEDKYHTFTVCFHGVMGFFQDIETLAKLVQHPLMLGVNFVFIGSGRKSDIIRSISAKNFKYFDRLPHSETAREISRCHLGISLRTSNQISFDSFPVKIWEYIGLGIPSLVFPPSEAGDFVSSHGCGIQLRSSDLNFIADVIDKLQSNSKMYSDMVEACKQVRPLYTRERLASEFCNIVGRYIP